MNVKSEVFKAGHAAVIYVTEDTQKDPRTHERRHFIGHSSVLFALLRVFGGEKREAEDEKDREGDLHICIVTG